MSNESRPTKGRSGQTRRAASTPKSTSSGLDMTTLVGLGVVVVVIALGVSFAMGLFDASTPAANAEQETAPVSVEGQPLPPFNSQGGGQDAAVGAPAPNITGQDFQGEETDLLVEGEANIIVFLAHWCPHCQAEAPLLVDEWAEGGLPDGVNATAVVTAQDPNQVNYPPSAWLNDVGWTMPVLLDSEANEVASAYGLASYPYFVVVDGAGNVVARTSGELGREQLRNLVDVAEGSADASTVETDEDSSSATSGPSENTGATENG